jgi:hypothetical protein
MSSTEELVEELSTLAEKQVHADIETESGETWRVYLVSEAEKIEATATEPGHFEVVTELDTDVHDIVPDEIGSESGRIDSRMEEGSDSWSKPTLVFWDPETDDNGELVQDRWETFGYVTSVSEIDDK